MNGKRTRIINDPSDLVPLLQAFGSEVHKKVFDELCKDWRTEAELAELIGDDQMVSRSVDMLRKSGLVETKWRVPQPGQSPEKEYHSTYSRVQANFWATMEDLSELIRLTFMSEEDLRGITASLRKQVEAGNTSLSNLSRELGLSQVFIRGVAKRAHGLNVRGQRVELSED
ncbi:MAG: ArsR transcriptional regulator [Methanosaeta sp. PtaB.Bin039]|nr:MAG: ArsR transcriptional regulator [Methanosaeta sp. PtaB.Bin039]OPY46325.1 MAG: ArsR transcriptional regulator [Methanosaeta sp. PtaU1.Bin028]HOT07571.1 ArsR family transcriptional regulator [Methanotrichaceae archaeon]HQF17484.1 ArsR family transcriptional regulator [Methanotrichaceae archaeon]HQI92000.1 ArsR family transcriptional regulator [Methanotrichaceae archaeon]